MTVIRGRMVITTIIYVFLSEVVHIIRAGRLGLLLEAWQIYTQDAPRLFSLLNTLHWLETSRSSPVISSLTPKDPYANQKNLAVCLGAICPDALAAAVGIIPTLGAFAKISELIAKFKMLRIGQNLDLAYKTPLINRWDAFAEVIQQAIESTPLRAVALSAPTATGKSTQLVATLLSRGYKRVWVVTHTRYLRDQYTNPWVPRSEILRLSAGVLDIGSPVAVCTYGHIVARHSAGLGPRDGEVVLFDEFHERLPIQGIASEAIGVSAVRVYLTATPDWFYTPAGTPYLAIPIDREYESPLPVRLDLPVMMLWAEAKRAGVDVSRCLFILPSINEVENVVEALISAGEIATAVTAKRRIMPLTGHVVGTSVVEAGVNIEPPATCLIDSGYMVKNDRGRISTCPTNPAVATQRLGRVARRGEGAAYVNAASGTGSVGTPYPTYLDLIAAHARRAWLLNRLDIADRLAVLQPHSSVDPTMRLRSSQYTRDERTALYTMWLLRASTGNEHQANLLYDRIATHGWPEELDSVANLIGHRRWICPRFKVQAYLDAYPYEMEYDGVIIRPSLLILRDGEILWK